MDSVDVRELCFKYLKETKNMKFQLEDVYKWANIDFNYDIKSRHIEVLTQFKDDFVVVDANLIQVNVKNDDELNEIDVELERDMFIPMVDVCIKIFKKKCDKLSIHKGSSWNKICVRGPVLAFQEVSYSIKKLLSKVTIKRLEIRNPNINAIIEFQHVKEILEKLCEDYNLHGKIQLILQEVSDLVPGIYLMYFRDSPEINTVGDFTFHRLEDLVKRELILENIDLKSYGQVLTTCKYNEFMHSKLDDKSNYDKFSFKYTPTDQIVTLFGRKRNIEELKKWLNELYKFNVDIPQEQILYLKNVSNCIENDVKRICRYGKIEYKIKSCFENSLPDEYELCVVGCAFNFKDEIVNLIQNICANCKQKEFVMDWMPGFGKMLERSNEKFKKMIDELTTSTRTCIKHEIKNNSDTEVQALIQEANQNTCIQIGNSSIDISLGNIVQASTDVIVVSTQKSLSLNCGMVSKSVLESAGQTIQDECYLRYPSGINHSEVAITSAGALRNVQKIYYISPSSYTQPKHNERLQELRVLIQNLLANLLINNLRSISIPSIGIGNLYYPVKETIETLLDECANFLRNNMNNQLEIKFVLFEQTTFQLFELEMCKLRNKMSIQNTTHDLFNPCRQFFGCKRSYDVALNPSTSKDVALFKIISDDKERIVNTFEMLKEKIFQDFILNERIDDNDFKFIPASETLKLPKPTPDVDIQYINGTGLRLVGYADDVLDATIKINEVIETHKPKCSAVGLGELTFEQLDNAEFQFIQDRFMESFRHNKSISFNHFSILKVVNPRLQEQYRIHKAYMLQKNGRENELLLFHGTEERCVNDICKYGFNRSFCGINGVCYGQGVYFARGSSYSDTYAKPSEKDSLRRMFCCEVLVGENIRGSKNMKAPPKKANGDLYDSTSDDLDTIYVVYNDNQCYPKFLIMYNYSLS